MEGTFIKTDHFTKEAISKLIHAELDKIIFPDGEKKEIYFQCERIVQPFLSLLNEGGEEHCISFIDRFNSLLRDNRRHDHRVSFICTVWLNILANFMEISSKEVSVNLYSITLQIHACFPFYGRK